MFNEISSRSWIFFILAIFIYCVQVVPRLSGDSPVGDEMGDIVNGYYYWKGDVLSHAGHPPLAKALQALPLKFLGLKDKTQAHFDNPERRAYNFLFILNRGRCSEAVAWARGISLLLGLGVGALLFWLVRRESNEFLAVVLGLWAFEPNLLAFSGFAMADISATFFFLASVFCFRRLQEKTNGLSSMGTGLVAAMAVTSKFSAGVLAIVFAIFEWRRWAILSPPQDRKGYFQALSIRWFGGLLAAVTWIAFLYLPGTLFIPGHLSPFHYFWDGFRQISSYSGYPTYFLGQLSNENHWLYFPLAFLLKTPPALLILCVGAWLLASLGKLKIPFWQWLPPLMFFLVMLPFVNIGLREILPVYPFLILMAAQGARWLWQGNKFLVARKIVLLGLLVWQVCDVGLAFPEQVSYLNPLVGSKGRLFYLGDSNVDLGQDTQRLAQAASRQVWKHIKLAYCGPCDPAFYGMGWSYWTGRDLKGPQPGWVYVVNAAYLQLGPAFMPEADKILHSWIALASPTRRVGATWYCYEIPGEALPDHEPSLPSAPPFAYFEALGKGLSREEAKTFLPHGSRFP
jgi:hypothetical protein